MNSQSATFYYVTAAEYLEGEEGSDVRHEYVNGRVYAMSGASDKHNEISFDIAALLKSHLKGSSCKTFLLDVKVEAKKNDKPCYYYPDVFVTCEVEDTKSPLMKRFPTLIIEVLSPSTWRVDEGEKLDSYSQIPSVQEIVLIAQDWPELIIHRRSNSWRPESFIRPEDLVRFDSVNLEVSLAQIYSAIPFLENDSRPWYLQRRPIVVE
jgi:Uma2 family endonuclease